MKQPKLNRTLKLKVSVVYTLSIETLINAIVSLVSSLLVGVLGHSRMIKRTNLVVSAEHFANHVKIDSLQPSTKPSHDETHAAYLTKIQLLFLFFRSLGSFQNLSELISDLYGGNAYKKPSRTKFTVLLRPSVHLSLSCSDLVILESKRNWLTITLTLALTLCSFSPSSYQRRTSQQEYGEC